MSCVPITKKTDEAYQAGDEDSVRVVAFTRIPHELGEPFDARELDDLVGSILFSAHPEEMDKSR